MQMTSLGWLDITMAAGRNPKPTTLSAVFVYLCVIIMTGAGSRLFWLLNGPNRGDIHVEGCRLCTSTTILHRNGFCGKKKEMGHTRENVFIVGGGQIRFIVRSDGEIPFGLVWPKETNSAQKKKKREPSIGPFCRVRCKSTDTSKVSAGNVFKSKEKMERWIGG